MNLFLILNFVKGPMKGRSPEEIQFYSLLQPIFHIGSVQFSSVAQSCKTLCNPVYCSTRLPCPSPTPRACSNSCRSSWWCHPTISSSVVPFSCLQSFPASGYFQMSLLCICGQSVGVSASASASVLPMNIQDWSPLGWTGWISLLPKWFSKVVSKSTVQKHQFFSTQLSLYANSHIHTWLLEKPKLWLDGPLSAK